MTFKLSVLYQQSDFSNDEIKTLENKIMQDIKIEDRRFGTSIIYRGIVFVVSNLFYNLDLDAKILEIKQLTTKSKIHKIN